MDIFVTFLWIFCKFFYNLAIFWENAKVIFLIIITNFDRELFSCLAQIWHNTVNERRFLCE